MPGAAALMAQCLHVYYHATTRPPDAMWASRPGPHQLLATTSEGLDRRWAIHAADFDHVAFSYTLVVHVCTVSVCMRETMHRARASTGTPMPHTLVHGVVARFLYTRCRSAFFRASGRLRRSCFSAALSAAKRTKFRFSLLFLKVTNTNLNILLYQRSVAARLRLYFHCASLEYVGTRALAM